MFLLANDEDGRVQRAALKSLTDMMPQLRSSVISQLVHPFVLAMLQKAVENPDRAAKAGLDIVSANLALAVAFHQLPLISLPSSNLHCITQTVAKS